MGNRQPRLNDDNSIDQQILHNISANNSDLLINQRENDRRNGQQSGMRQCVAFNVDINLDKRSIGLIQNPQSADQYYLDFIFDAEKACKITVYVCANQVRNANGQLLYFYVPQDLPNPNCYKFSKKLQQKFPKGAASIDFSKYNQDQLTVHSDTYFPLVIVMQIDKQQPRPTLQVPPIGAPARSTGLTMEKKKQKSISQITYAEFKKQKNQYQIRVLKQKIIFNSHVFDVYDIFDGESGMATEAQRKQCVVCFSRIQDTIVLPCRHLCLCHKCTQVVRVQTNKCPICRANVTSFLQFKLEGAENNQPQ